jgi:hypothetical protein
MSQFTREYYIAFQRSSMRLIIALEGKTSATAVAE